MNCPRCGGMMRASDFYFDGNKCTSWVCYRCGETIDEQILINRRVTIPAKKKLAETNIGQG